MHACISACSICVAAVAAGSAASAPPLPARHCWCRPARADTLDVDGEDAERAAEFARRFVSHHGCAEARACASIARCRRMPDSVRERSWRWPSARALAEVHGIEPDVPTLARAVGRGRRSAIGIWTFAGGGLVVEGGHRSADREGLGPLARAPAVSALLAMRGGRAGRGVRAERHRRSGGIRSAAGAPGQGSRTGRPSGADDAAAGASPMGTSTRSARRSRRSRKSPAAGSRRCRAARSRPGRAKRWSAACASGARQASARARGDRPCTASSLEKRPGLASPIRYAPRTDPHARSTRVRSRKTVRESGPGHTRVDAAGESSIS